MWKHYVYIHFRESDGVPFYVGKGTVNGKDVYSRASEHHKNLHWENTVNKHGIVIRIVASCKTDIEAQLQEKRIISEIGRSDLRLGSLVNKTDGGEGFCGLIVSDDLRKKRSIAASEPRSEAWVRSIRASRKNGGNGGVVKLGDKLSDRWRANISSAKMGNKNPHYGKTTKIARKVKDEFTGKLYPSVSKAAEDFNLNMKTLYNMLSGHRNNSTNLRFYDGM